MPLGLRASGYRSARQFAIAAAAALTGAVCLGATAPSMDLPLKPGAVVGGLRPYVVHRGDSTSAIAFWYRVNPVRVLPQKPARRGLYAGERLTVDTRRIDPRFRPDMAGVVVNIPEAEVYLVDPHGRLTHTYPVAVSVGDKQDPLGDTHVVCKVKDPAWVVPASIQAEERKAGEPIKTVVSPGPDDPLGPRYMGFWDGTFGLHGTNEPYSIKHYVSHGCVRFLPHDIKDLYGRVEVGTPVHVVYQPVLLAADAHHVWLSVYPDIYKLDYPFEAAVRYLAERAGVSSRLNWQTVKKAIAQHNGIVVDASWPHERPHPVKTVPVQVPSSRPVTPAPSPSTASSAAEPSAATPSPSPDASGTPEPTAPSLAPSASPRS
ncbi:MAG TPA: L,D-transpeptidase [Oscillatoriaceae cyanobacterium]